MTPEDDENWKRRREREKEQEEEEEQERAKELLDGKSKGKFSSQPSTSGPLSQDRFEEYLQRADTLMEQVNNLYSMFIAGVERLPPIERRKQLDQLMVSIQGMAKPTPAMAFRFNNTQSRYILYRDRWDKMLKDLESGKLKRRT